MPMKTTDWNLATITTPSCGTPSSSTFPWTATNEESRYQTAHKGSSRLRHPLNNKTRHDISVIFSGGVKDQCRNLTWKHYSSSNFMFFSILGFIDFNIIILHSRMVGIKNPVIKLTVISLITDAIAAPITPNIEISI